MSQNHEITCVQSLLQKTPPLLLAWYDENARVLPWRSHPSPYRVWVSEIMLQQTRVESVKGYFERFLKIFPTVKRLASAEETHLLKVWEGLGYYNRARNLQKAAQIIMQQYKGEIPLSYEKILSLPGIGEYTAGAIASIAYQIPVPAVDGNVLRVLARVLASPENIGMASVKKKARDEILKIIPKKRAGDFNQSFMELGATVCLPNGMPLCDSCPLSSICLAKAKNLQFKLPIKKTKIERIKENRLVLVIEFENKVVLRQRSDKGLLASMWEFPNEADSCLEDLLKDWNIYSLEVKNLGAAKHVFSHIEWYMDGYLVHAQSNNLPQGWIWVDKTALEKVYALPSAFKTYRNYFLQRMK